MTSSLLRCAFSYDYRYASPWYASLDLASTDLKRMFGLFKLVPSTVRMLMDTMKGLLVAEGGSLMQDQERLKVLSSVSTCNSLTVCEPC